MEDQKPKLRGGTFADLQAKFAEKRREAQGLPPVPKVRQPSLRALANKDKWPSQKKPKPKKRPKFRTIKIKLHTEWADLIESKEVEWLELLLQNWKVQQTEYHRVRQEIEAKKRFM